MPGRSERGHDPKPSASRAKRVGRRWWAGRAGRTIGVAVAVPPGIGGFHDFCFPRGVRRETGDSTTRRLRRVARPYLLWIEVLVSRVNAQESPASGATSSRWTQASTSFFSAESFHPGKVRRPPRSTCAAFPTVKVSGALKTTEQVERAMLDERAYAYLYNDDEGFLLHEQGELRPDRGSHDRSATWPPISRKTWRSGRDLSGPAGL